MISSKQEDFLRDFNTELDVLEGTIRSGKSHIGVRKFMLKCADSDETKFILAARDKQTAERNVIPLIEGQFGNLVEYKPLAIGGSQLRLQTSKGPKTIYVVGFEDKSRWKVILGSTLGGGFIDEVNLATMEFIREYFGRLISVDDPYTCMTLNPDDPTKEIYKEYIDRTRPLTFYDIPVSIAKQQNEQESVTNWRYWHFNFRDNPLMSEDKIERAMNMYIPGTIYYKTKLLGLRGRAENLVFGDIANTVLIDDAEIKEFIPWRYVAALDTSYSKKTADTNAYGFGMITTTGVYIKLEELVKNNKDVGQTFYVNKKQFTLPLAPSDVCVVAYEFLEENRKKYGVARDIVIDSPATVLEFDKMRKSNGWIYRSLNANSYKHKVLVIDRCIFVNSWIAQGKYRIKRNCKEHIRELRNYSFENGVPEDKNNHTIDETSYEWIPYRDKVGR